MCNNLTKDFQHAVYLEQRLQIIGCRHRLCHILLFDSVVLCAHKLKNQIQATYVQNLLKLGTFTTNDAPQEVQKTNIIKVYIYKKLQGFILPAPWHDAQFPSEMLLVVRNPAHENLLN